VTANVADVTVTTAGFVRTARRNMEGNVFAMRGGVG
jgi:2-methylaconitate cis-trans-isomerase PrpF